MLDTETHPETSGRKRGAANASAGFDPMPLIGKAVEMASKGFTASAIHAELKPHMTRAEVDDIVARVREEMSARSRERRIAAAIAERERQIRAAEIAAEEYRNKREQVGRRLTVAEIVAMVCKETGIDRKDLLGRGRSRELIIPRQKAMYLCVRDTAQSLAEIGRRLGGFDHTTIINACRAHCRRTGDALPRQMYERKPKIARGADGTGDEA